MSLETFFLARGTRKGALAQLRLEFSSALGDIAESRQATPLIEGCKAALLNPSDKIAAGFLAFIRVERILKLKGEKFSLNKAFILQVEDIEPLLKTFEYFMEETLKPAEKTAEEKKAAALEKEAKYRDNLLEKLKDDGEFFKWVKTQVEELDHQVLKAKLTPISRTELEKLTT